MEQTVPHQRRCKYSQPFANTELRFKKGLPQKHYLKNVIFGYGADNPWLVRVPCEIGNLSSVAAVNKKKLRRAILEFEFMKKSIMFKITSASSGVCSSPIFERSQT